MIAPMSECSRRCLLAGSAALGVPLVLAEPAAAARAVIATADVPVGGGVVVASRKVVVTQPRAGRFRVFSAVCTHAGCTVGSVEDRQIVCPCHGSRYAIATGEPVAGPAPSALPKRAFHIKRGRIFLD